MIETMRVDGLCKRNLETLIVDHMHFFLMRGEILGIIGLYDSGRSMLAKILAGIEIASEGEICLEGKPVSIQDVRHAHQLGIFCVRAKSTLIPDLTVIENMCLLHTDAGNRWQNGRKRFFYPWGLTSIRRKSAVYCRSIFSIRLRSVVLFSVVQRR